MILMISRENLSTLAKKGRIEIIRTLKAFPDNDLCINELARVAKVPTMTVWRGVKELKAAGFVKTRKVGNSISVRLSDDRSKLRTLKLIPDTDPQRAAAERYADMLGKNHWLKECRLFGNIGRGEHSPGEEVDVAVVFDDGITTEIDARSEAHVIAEAIKSETNVTIAPLFVPHREMNRKGGIASELRDKEVIWPR
jgi:predicted nucleotidyltransferase